MTKACSLLLKMNCNRIFTAENAEKAEKKSKIKSKNDKQAQNDMRLRGNIGKIWPASETAVSHKIIDIIAVSVYSVVG